MTLSGRGRRGVLRVYLGAAPGVGKTFAMLDEAHRRRERGADVVVGLVETHGRARTAERIGDLEVMPRRVLVHRGARFEELDVDALVERRPQVALVDELAHTNAPGSPRAKRWHDVEHLLDAGIDVITTVNVQHLESVHDVVESITGTAQREIVPDAIVRAADQIELVDMSPEALRKRMEHGNIYPPERAGAALDNYFRPGNLGALRELALLWVADRVDDSLAEYRSRHGITAPWETRERIVVAITGAPGGDQLVRRAARIATRARGQLVGVHVAATDGLRERGREAVARHRDLVVALGGTYREVTGDDVAAALVGFASSEGATQLVLGASGRTRRAQLVRGSVVADTIRQAAGIDVHVIATAAPRTSMPHLARRWRLGGIPRRRQLAGWALVLGGLPLLTAVLAGRRDQLSLATALLLYLAVAVGAGAIGGVAPALAGALAGSLLANYYLVPPVHTFTIGQGENLLALVVFLAVAATVSGFVTLAARRAHDAQRARAEAESLARATATLAGARDPLPHLLDHLRATFMLDGATVLRRGGDAWVREAASGTAPDGATTLELPLEAEHGARLVLTGGALTADDRRLLRVHADQLATALATRSLQHAAERARAIADADALRTALLRSVSHDLRAPLANIKAAVTTLLADDVRWDEPTQREFLHSVDDETDRLDRLVGNLLDMSRLQAGAIALRLGPVALDDVVASALASIGALQGGPTARFAVELPDTVPLVHADADLLERAIANVLANAGRFNPPGEVVTIDAVVVDGDPDVAPGVDPGGDADGGLGGDPGGDPDGGLGGDPDGVVHGSGTVELRVADHGPGVDVGLREAVMRPFQRLGDGGGSGVGLGLAVAHGFVTAMGGRLTLGDTAGRGLTVIITLPRAEAAETPDGPADIEGSAVR